MVDSAVCPEHRVCVSHTGLRIETVVVVVVVVVAAVVFKERRMSTACFCAASFMFIAGANE